MGNKSTSKRMNNLKNKHIIFVKMGFSAESVEQVLKTTNNFENALDLLLAEQPSERTSNIVSRASTIGINIAPAQARNLEERYSNNDEALQFVVQNIPLDDGIQAQVHRGVLGRNYHPEVADLILENTNSLEESYIHLRNRVSRNAEQFQTISLANNRSSIGFEHDSLKVYDPERNPEHANEMMVADFDGLLSILENAYGANSASFAALSRIKTQTFSEGMTPNSCMICLELFDQGEIVSVLGCEHFFHKECLDRWLSASNKCPLCRELI